MIVRFLKRYMSNFNLISFSILSAPFVVINIGLSRLVTVTILFFCWGFYYVSKAETFKSARIKNQLNGLANIVEKHTYLLLFAFILTHLLWSGLVMFLNPYEWGYNHGDSVFFTQTLWNLAHGLRPESSYFTLSGLSPVGDDPRYSNAYGYVSLFTLHHYWLPMLMLTPLYAIYPHPPMQIYSILLVVIMLGVPGMFWAIRAMGGSKVAALLGAAGYVLLPQTEIILFFKGYFDVLALAVMPWVFAALFARKWWAFYLAAFCLAAISLPYTYTVVFIGVVTIIFFRAVFPGAVVFLIGLVMMKIDCALYVASVLPYYKDLGAIPSFTKYYILDRTMGSLLWPLTFNLVYVALILKSGAFLAPYAIRRDGKWNLPVIGLFAVTGLNFILMLFRSVGWEAQRNANLIVPLYICTFKAYIDIAEARPWSAEQNGSPSLRFVATTCLFFSLILPVLWGGGIGKGVLASHYPLGANAKLHVTEDTKKRHEALAMLERYVPRDAPLAFRSEGRVDAQLANRQHVWHLGREPEGVKYYLFFGAPAAPTEGAEWSTLITKMKENPMFKLLYEDQATPMVIFENLKAHPIPRDESLLGWGVLLRIFGFGKG